MSSSVSSGLLGSATLQQKAGLSFQEKQGYDHSVFLQSVEKQHCFRASPDLQLFISLLSWCQNVLCRKLLFSCFLSCVPDAVFLKPSKNVIFPDCQSDQQLVKHVGDCRLADEDPKRPNPTALSFSARQLPSLSVLWFLAWQVAALQLEMAG